MRYVSGPIASLAGVGEGDVGIALYETHSAKHITVGAAIKQEIVRRSYAVDQAAWDFLSIALAAISVDGATPRAASPDGWTRELELSVAVGRPDLWAPHIHRVEEALRFLTTDIWRIEFREGGDAAPAPREPKQPAVEAVALLSGGMDSLIGALDLQARGIDFLAVSQTVRGDGDKQAEFARVVTGGADARLLQLNPNVSTSWTSKEPSQRSRSLGFLALAILGASAAAIRTGGDVNLYLSENGYIAINPPLTAARLGSLSTRTAHPEFLSAVQQVLSLVGLPVTIKNPYILKTKGEMLVECANQGALGTLALASTSCGRFQHYGYTHCGRCVPCQVRRAAFLRWGQADATPYVYAALGAKDNYHAYFDDVYSVAMATREVDQLGVEGWLGSTLSSPAIADRDGVTDMIRRGIVELKALHASLGVW